MEKTRNKFCQRLSNVSQGQQTGCCGGNGSSGASENRAALISVESLLKAAETGEPAISVQLNNANGSTQNGAATLSKPLNNRPKHKYRPASRHLMITPSLACQASCEYCFGPNRGATMKADIFDAAVTWIDKITPADEKVDITFHGGEPLIPRIKWFQRNLPILKERFGDRLKLHIQSNLWLLDDDLCQLFKHYHLTISTSLDGPEHINDAQRGAGYFQRTLAAIQLARSHGMSVGCVCTFTSKSAKHVDEIFDFFLEQGLHFTIHIAEPVLGARKQSELVLSPEDSGDLWVRSLDRYLENLSETKNSTLDSLIQSVSAQRGGICTFGDCLGGHLTVGSDGGVYLCQRYAEMPEYQFGNVLDCPSMQELSGNRLWQMFADRQSRIAEECGSCEHLDHCRGGCPYNTLAANGGSFDKTIRDPHCPAYKKIFGKIVDQATDETFSEENMAAVVQEPNGKAGLLRKGKLISLMQRQPHPYDVSQNAKRLVAAVALAATGSPGEATRKMAKLGLVKAPEESEKVLTAMHRQLTAHTTGFNNLYLHITFVCNLQCEHCYSQSGPTQKGFMSVNKILRVCYETAGFGFKHVVITGGEPLVHPKRNELLDGLAELRPQIKPVLTVLRSSLALKFNSELLRRIGYSTDEVVVSVDGNRETHDRQRGVGAYDLTVRNLRALAEMGYDTDLSLATMLPNEHIQGAPGDSVRQLAAELGIERIRFKPLLPIGRAQTSDLNIVPETQWGHQDASTVLANGFRPGASCGMGQNLYVEPDGGAYPCYACQGQKWQIGDITAAGGLSGILTSAAFTQLGAHTVNSNRKCQMCAVRYLCGGACRAWNPMQESDDLDTPPADCSHLHQRARSLLDSALSELGLSFERWRSVGLPLPEDPPRIWEYETNCTKS